MRAIPRLKHGRSAARAAVVLFSQTASVLGVLVLGWIAYWSFYDPTTEVLPPSVLSVATPGGWASSVLFLGDTAVTDRSLPVVAQRGDAYPFAATRGLLGEHDAVIVNLEAPLTQSEDRWPWPKSYSYKSPPRVARTLAEVGIDAVTLANNHMNDYGARGLSDTLAFLEKAGISHLGAHLSESEARRGLVVETADGRVGILAYLQDKPRWRIPLRAFALDAPFRTWPGAARLGYRELREDIARMKRHADVVVVVPHWGENYEPVDDGQRAVGRAAIDYGADAVIGHHSHEYQQMELYRGRPIVYSIGNYVFGTRGNSTMRFGVAAALRVRSKCAIELELVPLLTQNRIVDYQPRIPAGEELERFARMLDAGGPRSRPAFERTGFRFRLALGPSGSTTSH